MTEEKPKTIKCVLLDSSFMRIEAGERKRYTKGDEVELTETQLAAFKDLFEPVDAKDKAAKAVAIERQKHNEEKAEREAIKEKEARAKAKAEREADKTPKDSEKSDEDPIKTEKLGEDTEDDKESVKSEDTKDSEQNGTDPTRKPSAPVKTLQDKTTTGTNK